MPKLVDRTGLQYTRLKVNTRAPNRGKRTTWNCTCTCGNDIVVLGQNLASGDTKSCGCLRRVRRERTLKHGHCSNRQPSREYRAWCSAKARCYCPGAGGFKNYGAQGVSVCAEWRHDFPAFLRDMGECPDGYTLDRRNSFGNYEKSNCRWATWAQQARNRRTSRHLEHDGETLTTAEWAVRLETSQQTLTYRLNHGHTLGELVEAHRMPTAA